MARRANTILAISFLSHVKLQLWIEPALISSFSDSQSSPPAREGHHHSALKVWGHFFSCASRGKSSPRTKTLSPTFWAGEGHIGSDPCGCQALGSGYAIDQATEAIIDRLTITSGLGRGPDQMESSSLRPTSKSLLFSTFRHAKFRIRRVRRSHFNAGH